MTESEKINIIINFSIAVGTVGVVILAIWGDWVKSKVFGPILSLVLEKPEGGLVKWGDGKMSIFYHLVVVNRRSAAVAKNCRVLLKKMWRKAPNGDFKEANLQVPLILTWAPSEIMPPFLDLIKDQVLDFGYVKEGDNRFVAKFIVTPYNFEGYVHAGEVVRFGLEIVSDNFLSDRLQVFEVAWNGHWDANLAIMKNNLNIKEVAADK